MIQQEKSNYEKYRGKCKEFSEKAIKKDPTLRLVRGHYFCPIWGTKEQHWWCERPNGEIVDLTKLQFPSKGHGIYEEFDGWVECSNCGKKIKEKEAIFDSRYAFCSNRCYGQFVGIF